VYVLDTGVRKCHIWFHHGDATYFRNSTTTSYIETFDPMLDTVVSNSVSEAVYRKAVDHWLG
jgi:hypothetical protein